MSGKNNNKLIGVKAKTNLPILIILFLITGGYFLFALTRPMPKLTVVSENISVPSFSGSLSWPSYGQSAVGAQNFGVLATSGEQISKPIASIAKTVLALAVIKEKPLTLGQQDPNIVITDKDINFYKEVVKQNGSNVPVELGENLNQYQAFQALLIASGDNIADTLATWAFGSVENYLIYANKMVKNMGLNQTYLADTSGLNSQTVSSAQDLVKIGERLLNEPVLAEIVNQAETELPVVGKVKNYNTNLGQEGIIGIKTGTTDEAGGCLLFAAKKNVSGQDATIIGAILGAPNRYQVLTDTRIFLKSNDNNFQYQQVLEANQVVGNVQTPWGKKINIVAKDKLDLLMVPGEKISINISIDKIDNALSANTTVGSIVASYGSNSLSVPAILETKIPSPPIWWRLTHPLVK